MKRTSRSAKNLTRDQRAAGFHATRQLYELTDEEVRQRLEEPCSTSQSSPPHPSQQLSRSSSPDGERTAGTSSRSHDGPSGH